MVSYFSDLFTLSTPENIAEVCSVVRGKFKEDHFRWCEESFSASKVKEALFLMSPIKAPGPDGLPALYFQKYWHIVGQDVSQLVMDILNNNRDPGDINSTHIILIPKCKNPASPKYFRPISLCNLGMKMVSKTLANRIKKILPDIVDDGQSGFISGRLITNNALVAMECSHWLKKKKGKRG